MHEATRLLRPGMVRLDRRRLAYDLGHEHGDDKNDADVLRAARGDEGTDGYAVYKVRQDWPHGHAEDRASVRDLVAATPAAYADLWRYVLDVDLVDDVEASNRPVDEPLLYLLRSPRRIRAQDDRQPVGAARRRRRPRSRQGGTRRRPPLLEIADPFCPWNEGRYALEAAEDGHAIVAAGEPGPAELACTASDLGATYLGGTTFRAAAPRRPGRRTPRGRARAADAMFGWDPAPWSPYEF